MRILVLGAPVLLLAGAGLLASFPLGCTGDPSAEVADAGLEASADAESTDDSGNADAADADVVPKGARVLGLAVAIGNVDFQRNVQTAYDAGVRVTNVTFAWDEIERPVDSGAPDPGDAGDAASTPTQIFNPLLHIANLVLPGERVGATLAVDALDVGGSRAPAELAMRALDDPALAARYDKLSDYVLDQTPDLALSALLLASSVDVPLGDDDAKHAAFATFVAHASGHAHAVRPTLKVGFTVTADGAVAHKDRLAAAWAASDVIAVTYLPVDAAAQARAPSEVAADLERLLLALPAGKPILLREAGYPSSAACGSSEEAQAAFVSAVFGAWDRHPDRIVSVTFRELVDADAQTAARTAARYGHTDAAFLEFLQSLGLRSALRNKPAFDALKREAHARGF